jgi:hypothetical protein
MNNDEMKYNNVLNILRKSKPVLNNLNDIEEKVFDRIKRKTSRREHPQGILDFLFGWVYIGWVRSGLVAASVILIIVFLYQQAVIIKRINILNRQSVFIENQINAGSTDNSEAFYLYRLAGRKMNSGSITISERQMKRLMKSYSELEEKYKDLIKLIEDDPELMKYVEGKLNESNKVKFKL